MNKPKMHSDQAALQIDAGGKAATLALSGDWTVAELHAQEQMKLDSVPKSVTDLTIDASGLGDLDTSGAWMIISLLRSIGHKELEVHWTKLNKGHGRIFSLVSMLKHKTITAKTHGLFFETMMNFGQAAVGFREESGLLFRFFGQLCVTFMHTVRNPGRFRVRSIVYHVNEIGINAAPICLLMAFLISIVLGYQGATQLKLFGATVFTVNLVSITVLREMGVLITAIMVAGRSSSAFAAQIGVMQMNEEVAALKTIGLDPFELLILPRILGILIALPVLTFLADIAGLIGTYFVAAVQLDMTYVQFMVRLKMAVHTHSFYVGLIKAPFFAILIGMVGCMQGLQVRSSATELGARTTTAVVQSIFLVIVVDALFSILFTKVGY